ncbi:hypothetical protein CRE_16797 [Caenorhabditis remanei]|uniref:Uncharacterized protein n=1 Tax=Caenorhabditis remanei TaxID=31234 RepID=E3MAJ1_CAERE|nr:hypothetical protein CRE_16797 [Caenorhabditis remanei]
MADKNVNQPLVKYRGYRTFSRASTQNAGSKSSRNLDSTHNLSPPSVLGVRKYPRIPAKMKYDTQVIFLPSKDEQNVVNETSSNRNRINQLASSSSHRDQTGNGANGNGGDSCGDQENMRSSSSSNRNDHRTNMSQMDNREQRTSFDSRPISRSHQEGGQPEYDNDSRNESQNYEYHTDYDVKSWVNQTQQRARISYDGDAFYDNEYETMENKEASPKRDFQECANRPFTDNGSSPAIGATSRNDGNLDNVQSSEPIVNDSRESKIEEVRSILQTQQPFVEKRQLIFGQGFGIDHYPDTSLPKKINSFGSETGYARRTESEHPKSSNSTYHSEKNVNSTYLRSGSLMDQNRVTAPDSKRTPERSYTNHNENVIVDQPDGYNSPRYGPSLLNESRIQTSPSNRSSTPKPLLDQVYSGNDLQCSSSQPNCQYNQNATRHSSFLQDTGFPSAETISSSDSLDCMEKNHESTDCKKSQQHDPFSFSREDLMAIKSNSTYPPRAIRTITSKIGKLAKACEPKYTFNRFAKEFVPSELKTNVESFGKGCKTSTSTSHYFSPCANAETSTRVSIESQTDPKKVIATESQTDTDDRFEMYENKLIGAGREIEIAKGELEIAQVISNNKQAKINLLEAQMEQLKTLLKQKESLIEAKNEEASLLIQTLAVKEKLLAEKREIIEANDATFQKIKELPAVKEATSLDDVLKFLEAENEKIVSSKLLISGNMQWSGMWAPELVSEVVDQDEFVIGHVEGDTAHSSVTKDLETLKLDELSNDKDTKCKALDSNPIVTVIRNLDSDPIVGNSHKFTTEHEKTDYGMDGLEKLNESPKNAAESDVTAAKKETTTYFVE